MIDTGKYEGHTPAPWKSDSHLDEKTHSTILDGSENVIASRVAWCNDALIADAPLLLAEVKELREALITVQQSLVWDEKDRAMDGEPITLEALVAQVEQVRSDITEMMRND